MSTITFKALINDLHFDPKKGTLKIQLIAANYVSLDQLATLGPQDENVHVTLESAQTRLVTPADAEDVLPGEKGAKWLEEAARNLEAQKEKQEED